MNRFFYLITVIAIFVSCSKIEDCSNTDIVEVSFSAKIIQGNILTKSFSNEVLDNLEYDYPKIITLTGTTATGVNKSYTFDLTTGNTFSVQKGTYTVKGDCGYNTCVYAYKKVPLMVKNGGYQIEISDSKNYVIELSMAGFILAAPKENASYLKYRYGKDDNFTTAYLLETENYFYYIFAFGGTALYSDSNVSIELELGETETTEKYNTRNRYYVSKHLGKYFIFYSPERDMRMFDFSSADWSLGEF